MKHLLFYLLLLSFISSCTNDGIQSPNVQYSSDHVKDTIFLTKDFLENQIQLWGDSTILLTFERGGSGFIKFKNDSLFEDAFSSDSLIKTYHISDSTGTLILKFIEPRSAIIGEPSVFSVHIYKYESGSFYGSVENISPNLSKEKKFTDTMQMISWERWIQEELRIKEIE